MWLWVTDKLKVPSMCYFIFENYHAQPSSRLSTQGGSPWVQLRACYIIQDNAILLQYLLYTARQIKLQMYLSIPHFLVSHVTNSLYVWGLKEERESLVYSRLPLCTTYGAKFLRGSDLFKTVFFHLSRPLQVCLDARWVVEMKHRQLSGGGFLIVLPEQQIIKHPESTACATDCSSQTFSGVGRDCESWKEQNESWASLHKMLDIYEKEIWLEHA